LGVFIFYRATCAVDHVSETSDASFKVGRTIVGQIHASEDEPCRIYYRKLPGNTKGSIYFAHEPTTGAEQWYEMIGSRADGISDPEDGVALGEKFSYEIKVVGNLLTVTIMREGKDDVVQEVDMSNSGFADDWMYFKAGNYNQNNAGDPGEFAQVSFYELDVTHSAPTPPSGYEAPSDIPRFQPFLAECKLQGPTSSTLRDKEALNDGYSHPDWFYVVDGDKIRFNQSGDSKRTELGEDPGGFFNCDIRLVDGNMIIDFEGEEKVNMDVSYWTWPSYWKAGVYLQDDGVATAHFDDLFEEDGSQQNFFPSISITDPVSNTNFEPGSDIMINAEAEDSDGSIVKVEFFEGGNNKLGEATSPPI